MITAFLLAVLVPAADTWFQWSPRTEWTENRARAKAPKLSLKRKQLKKLSSEVDDYYQDNFGFRDRLIKVNSLVKIHWLKQSPVEHVLIGQENWLFYAAPRDNSNGSTIAEFQGRAPLSPAALAQRRASIEQRQAQFARHGIQYLFVVAPNKQSIYPEYLPLHIGPRKPGNHLDAMVEYMRGSKATFIDLRPGLIAAKGDGPLYFYSDSHWNSHGAYLGYRQIMQRLPHVKPLELSALDVQDSPRAGGDLANMIAMADEWEDLERKVTPKPGIRQQTPGKVLLIGDSFMTALVPFLELTFEQVRTFHVRENVTVERILQEAPDVVIDERVERYMMMW